MDLGVGVLRLQDAVQRDPDLVQLGPANVEAVPFQFEETE